MSEEKVWKYNRGNWEQAPNPLVWNKDDTLEAVLERAEYEKQADASFGGSESSPAIEVYKKKDNSSYLVDICLNSSDIENIFIDDYPSLIMFLRDFAPFLTLEQINFELAELRSMGEKAFQVWHGHDAYEICRQCDPREWERWQQRQREKAAKKQ